MSFLRFRESVTGLMLNGSFLSSLNDLDVIVWPGSFGWLPGRSAIRILSAPEICVGLVAWEVVYFFFMWLYLFWGWSWGLRTVGLPISVDL